MVKFWLIFSNPIWQTVKFWSIFFSNHFPIAFHFRRARLDSKLPCDEHLAYVIHFRVRITRDTQGKEGRRGVRDPSTQKFVGQHGIWAASTDVTSHL